VLVVATFHWIVIDSLNTWPTCLLEEVKNTTVITVGKRYKNKNFFQVSGSNEQSEQEKMSDEAQQHTPQSPASSGDDKRVTYTKDDFEFGQLLGKGAFSEVWPCKKFPTFKKINHSCFF